MRQYPDEPFEDQDNRNRQVKLPQEQQPSLPKYGSDDRKWALYIKLEWVDLDGEGHRLVLPHEVVAGVMQRANSIIAECRRDEAQRGVLTRGLKLRDKSTKRKPKKK